MAGTWMRTWKDNSSLAPPTLFSTYCYLDNPYAYCDIGVHWFYSIVTCPLFSSHIDDSFSTPWISITVQDFAQNHSWRHQICSPMPHHGHEYDAHPHPDYPAPPPVTLRPIATTCHVHSPRRLHVHQPQSQVRRGFVLHTWPLGQWQQRQAVRDNKQQ